MDTPWQPMLHRYLPPDLRQELDLDEFGQHFSRVRYPKGKVLSRPGSPSGLVYFLQAGAARSYYLKDGLEVNTWFAFEGEMVGSLAHYAQQPAREWVSLLEPSELIAIDLDRIRRRQDHDRLAGIFVRRVLEEYALFLEERLYSLQFMSSAERYEQLLAHEPELLQRVSLTHIASYLGISRETLSRLRGR
jgi:CRP-like cAMP-binding protein